MVVTRFNMSSTLDNSSDMDAAKLRLRTSLNSPTTTSTGGSGTQSAQDTVRTLNASEAQADKAEKDRKTYGRTPDGTGKQFRRITNGRLSKQIVHPDVNQNVCDSYCY
jgi:hypothetical protein